MEVWAHRGFRGKTDQDPNPVKENTMAAFEMAYDCGADGLEMDVRMCAENELIVVHDRTIRRPMGRLPVSKLTLKQAVSYYNMPRLEEVLVYWAYTIPVNLDIKIDRYNNYVLEHKVVDLLKKYDLWDAVLVSSVSPLALWRMRQIAPKMRLAWIMESPQMVPTWKALPIEAIHVKSDLITGKLMKQWHKQGLKVRAWTVNTREAARELGILGVDGIFTDHANTVPLQIREE